MTTIAAETESAAATPSDGSLVGEAPPSPAGPIDEALLATLAPGCDAVELRAQLDTIEAVADGRAEGGHVAAMPQSERFHWLTAPSSTIVQPSPVHTGLTDDPAGELDRLFEALVSRPGRRG